MKKTARLVSESSAFDGRVLLGPDELGLVPVSRRHVASGSRAGVWLIGCEIEDGTSRYCTACGAAGRIRSSWRRWLAHTPVGQNAVHLLVCVRRSSLLISCTMGIGIAMFLSFPSAGRRQPAESKPIGNSGIYRRRHRCLSHHRETMTTPGKTISPHCGKTLPNLSNKH